MADSIDPGTTEVTASAAYETLAPETLDAPVAGGGGPSPFGSMPPATDNSMLTKIIAIVVTIIVGVVVAWPGAELMASPQFHSSNIEALDQKAQNVLGLVTVSTATSGAISMLPNDMGEPIAEKLMDLSGDFLIVLAAIYLEKYLLTIFGLAACRILFPMACLALIASLLTKVPSRMQTARNFAFKFGLFSILVACVIPLSIKVSGLVESTYASDANNAIAAATQNTAEDIAKATGTEDAVPEAPSTTTDSTTSDGDVWQNFSTWIAGVGAAAAETASDVGTAISSSVTGAVETAKGLVNNLIEALAVMIVTNCVIPIVVILFFVWIVKVLLGIQVNVPSIANRPKLGGKVKGMSK